MAYRYGNRYQKELFPRSIEEYIAEEDPARVYDAFVEALKLEELGIPIDEKKVGNASYDPRTMLKILLYGYSYGLRSSRQLERALYHNISFMWISGGLKPDHKTLAEYRRKNKKALKEVLKKVARMCLKIGMIEGNILFVDGSKFRANASIKASWTKEKSKKVLEKLDKKISDLIEESERIDEAEAGEESLVKLREELSSKESRKKKVEEILEELEKEGIEEKNTTDKDSRKMKSIHGTHVSYNVQQVVDEKHGLIISSEAVSEKNDSQEFAKQIKKAEEVLLKESKVACGDAGYANTEELKKIAERGTKVVVPSQRQALHKKEKKYSKKEFKYDKEKDKYICPAGKELRYKGENKKKEHRVYKIVKAKECHECKNYLECTKSKTGRRIIRLKEEETRERLEQIYESKEGQEIYSQRKEKVELPFGHIKQNLGIRSFLLRGLEGVKAELSLISSCFNIRRMMTILGKVDLLKKLALMS